MTYTLGVDVSHYQGTIDWAKVAQTSYDFALCRMTIGRSNTDDLGPSNLTRMLGRIPVPGAYGVVGYTEPVTDGAKRLVDEIAATGAEPRDVLVMLDAEDFGDGRHPTIRQVNAYAIQLRSLIGRWPVAYVPAWWMGKYGYSVGGLELANCPWAPSHYLRAPWTEAKLLANRPTNLHEFTSLAWLQYTSSGTVPGISGGVDLNCFYGSLNDLRRQLLGAATLPLPQEDLTMATADDILAAITQLRNDLTAFGTKGLHDSVEVYASKIRDIQAKATTIAQGVGELSDDEANLLAAIAGIQQGMSDEQAATAAAEIATNLTATLPPAFVAALKEAL